MEPSEVQPSEPALSEAMTTGELPGASTVLGTRPAGPDEQPEATVAEASDYPPVISRRRLLVNAATAALAFGWGLGAGYWTWGRTPAAPAAPPVATTPPTPQPPALGLPHSYQLPIAYGAIGPQLIRVGAFTYEAFLQLYAQAGQPLTDAQKAILQKGSDQPVTIDHAHAYFLLNLLWAVGLVNNNRLLREGPLVTYSEGQIERYASTGGWSLAAKPIHQLYASAALVSLTDVQQARVEEAASAIYRPCCNNPTSFPDCNHGMAMLGLLELMAANDVDVDTMLEAAKMVNRFWFPEQSQQLARYYQAQTGQDFAAINAREAVGAKRFSSQGVSEVRAWLAANGQLETPAQNSNSCGV